MTEEEIFAAFRKLIREKNWMFKEDARRHVLVMPGMKTRWEPTIVITCREHRATLGFYSNQLNLLIQNPTTAFSLALESNEDRPLGSLNFNVVEAKFSYNFVLFTGSCAVENEAQNLFLLGLAIGSNEFNHLADWLAEAYEQRTIPRFHIFRSAPEGAQTEAEREATQRLKSQFLALKTNLATRYTNVLQLEGLKLTFTLQDNFTGFLQEQTDMILVAIRTTELPGSLQRLAPMLCWRFPLLGYTVKEECLVGVCRVCTKDLCLTVVELLVDSTVKQAEAEIREALQVCALLDFAVPKQRAVPQFATRFTYLLPSEDALAQLQTVLPHLQAHSQASALVFPESLSELRLFFHIPPGYVPLVTVLQSNRRDVLQALRQVQPLLSDYDFKDSALATFLSPDGKVHIATLGCWAKQRSEHSVESFVLGLVQSLEAPRNWRLDAETAALLHYQAVPASVLEISREANWHYSLSHPCILSSPGLSPLPNGQYGILRPAGLISLSDLLAAFPRPVEVFTVLLKTGEALAFLHSQGLCHLSLQPQHIFLKDRKTLAVALTPPAVLPCWLCASDFLEPFTAPELREGRADPTCDVYSFAQLIAYCWDPCITTTRFRSEQAFGELYTRVEAALRRQTPVALSSLLQALLNLVRA